MPDTDHKRMLEMAAKAAGYNIYAAWDEFGHFEGYRIDSLSGDAWNPLTDDGDALRLAVALGLSVDAYPHYSTPKIAAVVKQRTRGDMMRDSNPTEAIEKYGNDACAATRRAIVRAAAAIGEQMP